MCTPLSCFGVNGIFYCCNRKSSNVNEQTYAIFSSFFMFLNTPFRMKSKIEMNMYEYANELICIH